MLDFSKQISFPNPKLATKGLSINFYDDTRTQSLQNPTGRVQISHLIRASFSLFCLNKGTRARKIEKHLCHHEHPTLLLPHLHDEWKSCRRQGAIRRQQQINLLAMQVFLQKVAFFNKGVELKNLTRLDFEHYRTRLVAKAIEQCVMTQLDQIIDFRDELGFVTRLKQLANNDEVFDWQTSTSQQSFIGE